jgi:hypothetical protein
MNLLLIKTIPHMKKILWFAASAAMVFTSCIENEGTIIPEGEASIVVKIDGITPSTRAIEAAASPALGAAALDGTALHYIYVFNADDTKRHGEELVISAVTGTGQSIDNGTYFSKDSKIYVLANIPANIALTNLEAVADVAGLEALTSEIIYGTGAQNVTHSKPAMANTSGEPVALGTVTEGVATVNVNIAPLYSRIEFVRVTGGEHIVSFKVAGVYLENYYDTFTMTGKAVPESSVSNGNETPSLATSFGDETVISSDGSKEAAPAGRWAYHAAPADKVPSLIIKLTDVVFYEDDGNGTPESNELTLSTPRYLKVVDYTTNSNGSIAYTGRFDRGKIFTINALEFDHIFSDDDNGDNDDELPETPDPNSVKISATVTIANWGTQTLYPVLGN